MEGAVIFTMLTLHCIPRSHMEIYQPTWCHGVLLLLPLCQGHPYVAAVLHPATSATQNRTTFSICVRCMGRVGTVPDGSDAICPLTGRDSGRLQDEVWSPHAWWQPLALSHLSPPHSLNGFCDPYRFPVSTLAAPVPEESSPLSS